MDVYQRWGVGMSVCIPYNFFYWTMLFTIKAEILIQSLPDIYTLFFNIHDNILFPEESCLI